MRWYGNFTSSNIWKLTTSDKAGKDFGAQALTYIKEKQMEIRLQRRLNTETTSRPTSWGTLVERRAFDLLSMEYQLESTTNLKHPTIEGWTGTPDLRNIKEQAIGDIKCPFTLKSFCEMVDSFGDLEAFKKSKPEYYWQLVSNAIITGMPKGEIVVYCPYLIELDAIREMANNFEGDQNKVAWVNWANDSDLPYLVEGGYYKNLNTWIFDIAKEDIDFLTDRVTRAIAILQQSGNATTK
jgi:hypothetical protein